MSDYVVTISRQFASMGRTIGLLMAENLGIELYDRDIVKEAARRMAMSKDEISHYDEAPGKDSFFFRRNKLFDFSVYSMHDNVFETQKNIILDFANKGSCIIVGRCADYILKDKKNVLNIEIYAPFEQRIINCINELYMTEAEAIERIKKVDECRKAYKNKYCKNMDSVFGLSHIMIDSSRFGIEKTVQLLTEIVKNTVAK